MEFYCQVGLLEFYCREFYNISKKEFLCLWISSFLLSHPKKFLKINYNIGVLLSVEFYCQQPQYRIAQR
jgi:hypothetical protein